MRLRVIVPVMPPVTSGVGDYALIMARHMRETAGVETEFFVGDPAWKSKGATRIEGFPVEAFAARTPAAVTDALSDDDGPVFLHYVGYGYHPKGVPFWLLNAMRVQQRRGVRVATFFHELEASGPVLGTAFWLRPAMRWIWKRLARLSAARFCTTGLVQRLLAQHAGVEAQRFAVFSTIGEAPSLVPFAERRRRMILFGNPFARGQAYVDFAPMLERAVAATGVEEIVDIGPPFSAVPAAVAGVPVRSLGILEADAIRSLMAESMVGYVPYPIPFICKSTIVAAYTAHGMLTVLHDQPVHATDGIEAGRNVLLAGASMAPLSIEAMAPVAAAGRAWYDDHTIARASDGILAALRGDPPVAQKTI